MDEGNGKDHAPVICIGCQKINATIQAAMQQFANTMVFAELAFKCDRCGKFLITGRMYNPAVYVQQPITQPTIVKAH